MNRLEPFLKTGALLALLIATPSVASAHPAVGIVVDSRGNVFYSDLHNIWMIRPDGRKSIAVRDVHAHEISVDSAGSVVGEDVRYEGGDRYRHRIWKRSPDGRVTDVVPWTEGFFRQYGFTHDAAGNMYWSTCPERVCSIRVRRRDGRVETFAPNVRYRSNINWIAAMPDGSVWVVDAGLRRITPDGRAVQVTGSLGEYMFGLLPDARGGVYVPVGGARAVMHVTAAGRVTTVARTPKGWGPSGVAFDRSGAMWILEWSTKNEARVRKIWRDGRQRVF